MTKEYRCWVYHPEQEPKIVTKSEAESLYLNGWFDSPAGFVKTTQFGIDPEDEVNVQALGDTIEAIASKLNDELNFDIMTKKELDAYAQEHFDVEFDLRTYRGEKGHARLIEEVKDLAGVK